MTASSETASVGQLRALIERIERLEEEKQTIADDIKDIYAEAKGNGFDTKAIRTIIRLRKKDQAEREEEEAILDTYMAALGMLPADEGIQITESCGDVYVDLGFTAEEGRRFRADSAARNSEIVEHVELIRSRYPVVMEALRQSELRDQENFPDPRLSGAADGRRGIPSSDADGAKMQDCPSSPAGQGAHAHRTNIKSEQAVTNSSSALSSSMASETAGALTSSPDVPADQFEGIPDFIKRSHAHHDDRSAA